MIAAFFHRRSLGLSRIAPQGRIRHEPKERLRRRLQQARTQGLSSSRRNRGNEDEATGDRRGRGTVKSELPLKSQENVGSREDATFC